MNGIDISGHQPNIDLAKVPCDFVIIKATQGTSFISKAWQKQVEQAVSLGKLIGLYHYANGAGVDVEADHFIDVVRPYLGKAILCVDWENNKKDGKNDNPMFVAGNYKYCEQLLVAIEKKTGIKPFLYMSKTVARQFKWEVGRQFPFWCAQYKKTPPTTYVANPWTDDKGWGAWNDCKIFQYTSKGRLTGYNANLDLDKSYMTRNEWLAWAGGDLSIGHEIKPILRKGDRNEYVRSWQTLLKLNNYYDATIDGIFGEKTEKSVIRWQQDHQMESGYIGEQTWNTI